MSLGLVDDDLAAVRAVDRADLLAQLALEALGPRALLAQLVLETQHVLDTGEVRALGGAAAWIGSMLVVGSRRGEGA